MKRWIKRILLTIALGGFAAAMVYAFLPKPVPVDMAEATRGPLAVAVEEDGKTRLRDRYTVSAPLAGRLLRIDLRAGDPITKTRVLAVIEPADPALLDPRAVAQSEARVKAARIALERAGTNREAARHSLELAEAELARARKLERRDAASLAEIDQRQAEWKLRTEELRAARLSEEIARFELELAEAAFLRTRPPDERDAANARFEIPPPALPNSGRVFQVLRVFEESETIVAPGTPLLELGEASDLEVEVDVLSSDAVKIRPGARVLLEQWGGDVPLEARVRLVEPSGFTKISALGVEEQRVNVIIDFADREKIPPTLRDGFRVEARIIVWEAEDVLRVPTSALFRRGEEWAVFRVEGGRAFVREVKVGRRSGLAGEITGGLAPGDLVIVHPSDRVADSAEVTPR